MKRVPSMDFFELIDKRRSVKKLSNETIPGEVIIKALNAALLPANSSNLQPWEFYLVKNKNNRSDLIETCFSQNVVKTVQELIVAISRIDTWKRNRNIVLENYKIRGNLLPVVEKYYNKFIPLSYVHDPMGLFGGMKTIMSFFLNIVGYF